MDPHLLPLHPFILCSGPCLIAPISSFGPNQNQKIAHCSPDYYQTAPKCSIELRSGYDGLVHVPLVDCAVVSLGTAGGWCRQAAWMQSGVSRSSVIGCSGPPSPLPLFYSLYPDTTIDITMPDHYDLLHAQLNKASILNKSLRELLTESIQKEKQLVKENERLQEDNYTLKDRLDQEQENSTKQTLRLAKKEAQVLTLEKTLHQFQRLFRSLNKNGEYDRLLEMSRLEEPPSLKRKNTQPPCQQLQLQFNKSLIKTERKKSNEVSLNKATTQIEEITFDNVQPHPFLRQVPVAPPADQLQLFEEFMVIGVPKAEINALEKHQSVLLSPQILFSYPGRPQNEKQEWRTVIPDFAFPFGCQVDPIDFQGHAEKVYSQIFQSEVFSHQRDSFVFTVKNEESYLHDSSKDVLRLCNPNRVLYAVCMLTTDYYSTEVRGGRVFWEVQKVYCFITKYPFVRLFLDLTVLLLATVKKKRVAEYTQNITRDMAILSHIDAQFIHHHVLDNTLLLQKALFVSELQFQAQIKIEYNSARVCFQLPAQDDAYLQESLWSQTVTFSSTSLDDLIFLYFAILMEYSVIFLSNNLCLLTSTILTLSCMLHPFRWPHPNILILPEKLFGLLDSPVPILMGINRDADFVRENELTEAYPHCIFACLDDQLILSGKDTTKAVLSSLPEFSHFKALLKPHYSLLNPYGCLTRPSLDKHRPKHSIIYNPTPEEQAASLSIARLFKSTLHEHIIDKLPKDGSVGALSQALTKQSVPADSNFIGRFVQTQIFEFFVQHTGRE